MNRRLVFDTPLEGESIHDLSIDIEHRSEGRIHFTFDTMNTTIKYGNAYEAPTREWVASAGNALKSDDNLDYFSSLGPVEVFADVQ